MLMYTCCLQALEVYPQSGRLLGMLAECEQRGHTLSRLRLHLSGLCQDTPAALLWLMAIKAEAVLPAGSHRVQVKACCCALPPCACELNLVQMQCCWSWLKLCCLLALVEFRQGHAAPCCAMLCFAMLCGFDLRC